MNIIVESEADYKAWLAKQKAFGAKEIVAEPTTTEPTTTDTTKNIVAIK
jgi:heme/copper-type cytochrome/quinol oxidase subunit 2